MLKNTFDWLRDNWRSLTVQNGECFEWVLSRSERGYGQYTINYKNYRAHRAVWIALKGPIQGGLFVLHRCDNPPCVNPAHLWLGTALENKHDEIRKGHFNHKGERNGQAILNEKKVREIRSLYPSLIQYQIANKYGVSRECIGRIIRRDNWRHVV